MIISNLNFSNSALYNEKTFYTQFLKDLNSASSEIIIESPYITSERVELFEQIFQRLLHKGISIHIITRDPADHENEFFRHQATNEILKCKELGIHITMFSGFHHRKLAIIDQKILWEGSLNILSHRESIEIMRRIHDQALTKQMFDFLNISKFTSI